jgi:hypothetical protein
MVRSLVWDIKDLSFSNPYSVKIAALFFIFTRGLIYHFIFILIMLKGALKFMLSLESMIIGMILEGLLLTLKILIFDKQL